MKDIFAYIFAYTHERIFPPMLIPRDIIHHVLSYVPFSLIPFPILSLIHRVDCPYSNNVVVRANVFG